MEVDSLESRVLFQLLAPKVKHVTTGYSEAVPLNCTLHTYSFFKVMQPWHMERELEIGHWLVSPFACFAVWMLSKIRAPTLILQQLPSLRWFDGAEKEAQNPHVRRLVVDEVDAAHLPVLFDTLLVFFPNLAELELSPTLRVGGLYGKQQLLSPEQAFVSIMQGLRRMRRTVHRAKSLGIQLDMHVVISASVESDVSYGNN